GDRDAARAGFCDGHRRSARAGQPADVQRLRQREDLRHHDVVGRRRDGARTRAGRRRARGGAVGRPFERAPLRTSAAARSEFIHSTTRREVMTQWTKFATVALALAVGAISFVGPARDADAAKSVSPFAGNWSGGWAGWQVTIGSSGSVSGY